MRVHGTLGRTLLLGAWLGAGALGAACGGDDDGDGPAPPAPQPAPGNAVLVVITDTGLSPRLINVRPGGQVTFRNDDARAHQLSSDPHPDHTLCPEYNNPVLQQGELFTATAQPRGSPCALHDHLNPDDRTFRGTVTVSGG
jgi:plastocyanin